MSAARSRVVLEAIERECGRCELHGHPCSRHMQAALEREADRTAHLEHQVAVLTVALAQTAKAVA